jgi:hypothetical protein
MYNHLNIKVRILVVDSDPRSRVASQSFLLDWGYDPVLAMGHGARLIAHAKNEAHDKCCGLALIDMRLYDDQDVNDDSGLKLANELSNMMSCIIFSGHEDQLIRIFQDYKNLSFINKVDSPDKIKERIDTEARKVSAAKRGLEFEDLNILDEISRTALGSLTKQYPEQVVDILARLFPAARKLRVEKFDTHPWPLHVSTTPRPTSMISKVYGEQRYDPYIVKVARAEKIQKEIDRYNRFVDGKVTERFTGRLVRHAILWDIGAAAYSYPGDNNVISFSRFYEEQPIADIEESLKFFFNYVWARHYLMAYDKFNVSLFNLYTEVWGNWFEKCVKAFPITKPLDISFVTKELNAPDPVHWLRTKIVEGPGDVSMINITRIAITHGDLHGENLLIDSKKNALVIDFERCGEGHALQDFIELETDIINRLGTHSLDPFEYIKMLLFILRHKKIQDFDGVEILTVSENKRIEKALHTISMLRSLAVQHTGINDAREYVFGLLFNMIFRATIARNKDPHKGPHQALMFASIICHRLDHWDELWPPPEWGQLLE